MKKIHQKKRPKKNEENPSKEKGQKKNPSKSPNLPAEAGGAMVSSKEEELECIIAIEIWRVEMGEKGRF